MTDAIIVYATAWCPDCRRARFFLKRNNIPCEEIDIDQNPEAAEIVKGLNGGNRSVPTLVFPDGSILVEPSNSELAAKLGLAR
jgi:mycoredoxin